MAENEDHNQEAEEQNVTFEQDEHTYEHAIEIHEVLDEGRSEEPADGLDDTKSREYVVELPSDNDMGATSVSSASLIDEETVNKTSEEIMSMENPEVINPTEDLESPEQNVGENPVDEVTAVETMVENDVTTEDMESAGGADMSKPEMAREGLIIIDCTKIGTENCLEAESDQSNMKPEDVTAKSDTLVLDCSKCATTESPTPIVSNEYPEAEEPETEPAISCDELREKLEAQIAAIAAVHGKIEPEKTNEKLVSKGTDATECLVYRTPSTAADRDLKKRSVLQAYPPLPKTPPPDIASSTATVKVALLPTGDVMTVALPICLTTGKLKARFGKELKVPANKLEITCDSKPEISNETFWHYERNDMRVY